MLNKILHKKDDTDQLKKKRSVSIAYSRKVRPSTHTNISTTHAIEREHLACLLLVRSVILAVLP